MLLQANITAAKENSSVHKGARGTDFAAKEQNTERLKALRKRVREYEAALSRGLPPPAPPPASFQERRTVVNNQKEEISPRETVITNLQADPFKKSHLDKLRLYLSKSTNNQEKASLGTAYCLGCLVTDQWNEGTRMAILVRKAYPKNPDVKLLTLQPFASDCPKCGGSGQIKVKCETCHGKKKCQFYGCDGGILKNQDLRIAGKAAVCPQCGGSGECRRCNGTGQTSAPCPECAGRGKTLKPESIEKGYRTFVNKLKP